MEKFDAIKEGKRVFDLEVEAIKKVENELDDRFETIVNMIINCKGKIIFTGMGKSGHIAKKLAATFASLGTPSFCLHPAEALHGDLGMISKEDVVLVISFSGESEEVIRILPNIHKIGAKIIGISATKDSTLLKQSDFQYLLPMIEEACYMKLAPTSSTTAELVLGDAIAVAVAKEKAFNKNNFALFHPAGTLGKSLITTVGDLMSTGNENTTVTENETFEKALEEMCKSTLGMVNVIDNNNHLIGIFTDGDLRRKLAQKVDIYNLTLDEIIERNPITLRKDMLASEALRLMVNGPKKVSVAPVIEDNGTLIGSLTVKDIIKSGINL